MKSTIKRYVYLKYFFNFKNSIFLLFIIKIVYTENKVYSSTQDGQSQPETKVDKIDDLIQDIFDTYEDDGIPSSKPKNQDLGSLIDSKWKNLLKTTLKSYDQRLCAAVYKAKLDDIRADYACENFYEMSAFGTILKKFEI
jgi:hypothetical protein